MMGTKSDFTQKLLNDLRLRKERMAAAQNSEAFGNSRQVLKGSRETKTLNTIGSKIGSTYRNSGTSQKSIATVQATNQIVPYGRGHHSGQTPDFSMALAYAFDDAGKLKSFDFTGNGAVISFLQQIGNRSMPQSSNMQWQSTTQFPTLTHLHIDEIAKGAQKLNCILRASSNGFDIDKGSIEVGKELWKGAMELEQSLRMLVSLQEASESMASPQKKSRLQLLEDGEDSEDNSPISTEKQKQVDRPVFSFDKASKSRRANVQPGLQQKLMALTYLNEAPSSMPEKQVSKTSKSSHRRSASCGPELHTSQQTNSSKLKHDPGKIPNVIAKLMGLEEFAHNVNARVDTESQTISKQRSGEVVSTRNTYESPASAEVKIKYAKQAKLQVNQKGVQSNKITIMNSHNPQLQTEAYKFTYDYSYRPAAHPQKPRENKEEREPIINIKESNEAIFKINELQSQLTQLNKNHTNQKEIRREIVVGSSRQHRQEVKDDAETLQTTLAVKKQSSEAAGKIQVETLGNWNTHGTEKRVANKTLLHQQQQKKEFQLQVLPGYETQGKKLKSEDRSQQRAKNISELRKTKGKSRKLKYNQNVSTEMMLQKQPHNKQPNPAKGNNPKAKAAQGSHQNKVPVTDGRSIRTEAKQKSSESLEPEEKSSKTNEISQSQTTNVCIASNMDAKPANLSADEVVHDTKPPKIGHPTKTNEVMTRTIKTATKTARALNTQRKIPHGLKQKRIEKISISEPSQITDRLSMPEQLEPENSEPRTLASQQQVNAEQTATTNNPNRDGSQCQEDGAALPPSDKSQDTQTSKDSTDQHDQQIVPGEAKEIQPQRTRTDGYKDSNNMSYDLGPAQQQPTKMEKEPLTEDEMDLKQKLIKSNLFLNTAEALFKLNIPISVLNYASEQVCQEKDSKLALDCGYEVLKRKGRRQEIFFYPHSNIIMNCTAIRSLDDLVRQLQKEFDTLRSYGRNGRDEYDEADYLLKMLERDINYRDPYVNCMWDLGWYETKFGYIEMDEVIIDVERGLLDELVDEIAKEFM